MTDGGRVAARLIAISGVATLLGLSVPTVERHLAAGKLPPPRRIGRANRWDLQELSEWLARPNTDGRLKTAKEWQPVWAALVKRSRV